jgi:hypothetical protein
MESTEYNGWTNYETWLVALWIDNDEGTYTHWRHEAKRLQPHAAAGALKQAHEDGFEETVGLYADLINAALSRVNWIEIAKSLSSD